MSATWLPVPVATLSRRLRRSSPRRGGRTEAASRSSRPTSCSARRPGDAKAAARRLEILAPITLVRVNAEAANLADGLLRAGGLPQRAGADALHIAVAAAHGLDYLLTWNCKHIANASLRGKIEAVCRAAGFEPPVICTPQELIRER